MCTLGHLLDQGITLNPEGSAVISDSCTGIEPDLLTYKDVKEYMHKISHILKSHQVDNGVVGILWQNNVFLPSYLLGIMDAQAAFCPLSADIGSERLAYIVRTLHIQVILCECSLTQYLTKTLEPLESSVQLISECDCSLVLISTETTRSGDGSSDSRSPSTRESIVPCDRPIPRGSAVPCDTLISRDFPVSCDTPRTLYGHTQCATAVATNTTDAKTFSDIGNTFKRGNPGNRGSVPDSAVSQDASARARNHGDANCTRRECNSSHNALNYEDRWKAHESHSGAFSCKHDTSPKQVSLGLDKALQPRSGTPAYVITTSGTTGLPKIVRVPHQSIVPNILHLRDIYKLCRADVVYQASPLTFDPSIVEIFTTLSRGATLLILPPAVRRQPSVVCQKLQYWNVTVIQCTPSLLSSCPPSLLRGGLLSGDTSLRVVALGGEPCPAPRVLQTWKGVGNTTRFLNLYGITEVSSWATWYELAEEDFISDRDEVPLGGALWDTLLDVRPVTGYPPHIGQLFIGGQERVCVLDSEPSAPAGTMRSSGDLVERGPSGQLWYRGRLDDQIKRHGQRVNLCEIEKVALQCRCVQMAACVHHADRLYLFVVIQHSGPTRDRGAAGSQSPRGVTWDEASHGVRAEIARSLPSYYQPDVIRGVERLPVTDHGKVDRKKLKGNIDHERDRTADWCGADWRTLSRDQLMVEIGALWKGHHGVSDPEDRWRGVLDPGWNFIRCGGDSFQAVILADSIESRVKASTPSLPQPDTVGSHIDTSTASLPKPDTVGSHIDTSTASLPKPDTAGSHIDTSTASLPKPDTVGSHIDTSTASLPKPDTVGSHIDTSTASLPKPDTVGSHIDTSTASLPKPDTVGSHIDTSTASLPKPDTVGSHIDTSTASLPKPDTVGSHIDTSTASLPQPDTVESHIDTSTASLPMPDTVESHIDTTTNSLPKLLDLVLHKSLGDVVDYIFCVLLQWDQPSISDGLSDATSAVVTTAQETPHGNSAIDVAGVSGADWFIGRPRKTIAPPADSLDGADSEHPLRTIPLEAKSSETHSRTPCLDRIGRKNRRGKDRVSHRDNVVISMMESPFTGVNLEPDAAGWPSKTKRRRLNRDMINSIGEKSTPSVKEPQDGDTCVPIPAEPLSTQQTEDEFVLSIGRTGKVISHWQETVDYARSACHSDARELCHKKLSDAIRGGGNVPTGLGMVHTLVGDGQQLARLSANWSYDTGKCVDASPLVALTRGGNGVVFIGSHSHRFSAVRLSDGGEIWRVMLGDRVESTACLSMCGRYVIVGCYDKLVYTLVARTGVVHWQYATEGEVKSSPCVNPRTGLVYVGSHDHYVHAIDVEVCQCRWRRHGGGGSVFASPCLALAAYHLYVATLAGVITCLHPDTGDVIWSQHLGKPLFSSPASNDVFLAIGSVDGAVYLMNHDGVKLACYQSDGPVFSSPCVCSMGQSSPTNGGRPSSDQSALTTPDWSVKTAPLQRLQDSCIVIGSHDGHVHCIDGTGRLLWKHKADSWVYSSPFVFRPPVIQKECVLLASVSGTISLLELQTGKLVARVQATGQIFSSPVAIDDVLVVGCRDDFVYCFDIQ